VKYSIIFILVFLSKLVFSQVTPTIEIFQANLTVLSDAFENREYQIIDQLTHHKQVTEEILKREVELAINDSILPPQAISLMNKMGQFGSLSSVIKDEMAYKRYIDKAGVELKDCYTYFFEKNGMDVFVIAEWNGDHFRFIRIKNLKVLLH
jgi:predicted nucleic acid-binding protein